MKFFELRLFDGLNRSSLTDSKKSLIKVGSLTGSVILMLLFGPGMVWAEKITGETRLKLKDLKVPFISNQGQIDREVKFYAKTFSGTIYVTDQGKIVYQLPRSKKQNKDGWVLVEEALESLPIKEIRGEKETATGINYFLGNDRTQWKHGLSTHEIVDLGEVFKGIVLKLRAYEGKVEKLYYVSPGGDPEAIKIKIKGAESLKINDKGELEVQTGNGLVVFSRPQAYQYDGVRQKEVKVAYIVDGDRYGFEVGSYDKKKELIIDPLIQSTYLGGNGGDTPYSMTVSGGGVYVAGYTDSTNFPGTTGGAQPGMGSPYEAFVSLLTADLKQLVQSTYLGGNGGDQILSVVVSGVNVYVAGETNSSNFPGTLGGAQPVFAGMQDTFISLLTADLKNIIQSTYLGASTSSEWFDAMAVSGGNVYVAGMTSSSEFPKVSGGAQSVYGGGSSDTYVSLLTADLKQLVQSTFLGGNAEDRAFSLFVSGGNVYVAGRTSSSNFPGTAGGAQSGYGGGSSDAFVSILSADLKQLVQSTYLGGNGSDYLTSMVVSGGNVFLAGSTDSTNFPRTAGGAQPVKGGGRDAYASLLTADLKQLAQSTYLGGTGNDYAYSLVVSGGNVYVAGHTDSTDFPATTGGARTVNSGKDDVFVSRLTADLKQLVQSTYLGGTESEYAPQLNISEGNAYVAGETYSTDFPRTAGGAQSGIGGGTHDGFVALLSADLRAKSPPYVITGPATNITINSATLKGTVNAYGSTTIYYFELGTTTNYGKTTPSQSAGNGTNNVPVSFNLTGLVKNATYHYRLVAISGAGTSYGSDMSFIANFKANPWLMLLLK